MSDKPAERWADCRESRLLRPLKRYASLQYDNDWDRWGLGPEYETEAEAREHAGVLESLRNPNNTTLSGIVVVEILYQSIRPYCLPEGKSTDA